MDWLNGLERIIYVVASVFFIFGLKKMAHPRTAVTGNLLGVTGMALATAVALLRCENYLFPLLGMAVGGAIGAVMALRVQMTSMPQLVALLNGFGGLASVFVAGGALLDDAPMTLDALLATGLSGLIGGVTFSGSFVAYGKLEELAYFKRPLQIPNQQVLNAGLAAVGLILVVLLAGEHYWTYLPLVLTALALGYFLTTPIGGADMPVVIALLNSYSGLAAAATGFVINNYVLIISGSLVGASGIILTRIMCQAMNRSITNVVFGVLDSGAAAATSDNVYANVRSTSADDIAMILDGAQRVVIIPGYGMAVAQAQHAVRDLANLLEERGTTVEFAIHPVAGRMPGHMNVLLAEANVPYDEVFELEDINAEFAQADVAYVIGANDVTNPAARDDKSSPIYGMPILDVDKARTCLFVKRSLGSGYAGIDNTLFYKEGTMMLLGDAKKMTEEIVKSLAH